VAGELSHLPLCGLVSTALTTHTSGAPLVGGMVVSSLGRVAQTNQCVAR
jgi:hypothetical protein